MRILVISTLTACLCLTAPQSVNVLDIRPIGDLDKNGKTELVRRQAGFFVPNLGQWEHPARFVHRNGPMTMFLQDRGWMIALVERPVVPKTRAYDPGRSVAHAAALSKGKAKQKVRSVAVKMTFEGDMHVPKIVGEQKLEGQHNYFLGNDESRWRTGVPLYGSVRYEGLYPGIDLRLRQANGVPEYDLLLQPGADLSQVSVHVEGAQGLSIARDGSLVIETALGPVTQSLPKTWQVGGDGRKHEVACNFTLLGANRFGFEAPAWVGDTSLTIDPGLIWSTFLGGNGQDEVRAIDIDATGVVTVAGWTPSTDFPTTSGAYDRTNNGGSDIFVSRLDPSKTGTAQLVYSTFLGGSTFDYAMALSVDVGGVVTVVGVTGPSPPTSRRPAAPMTGPTTLRLSLAVWTRARPEPRSSSTRLFWGALAPMWQPGFPSTPMGW